jgi:hypothetical protein
MSWLARLGLFASGLFLIVVSLDKIHRGHWVFANGYRQTTFAASGIGIGFFFLLLTFLPPSKWVFRHITTKREPSLQKSHRRSH